MLLAVVLVAEGRGEVLRQQVVSLAEGWNAVHLEVEPQDPRPAAVFAGAPVDIVARYFRLVTPVEFISDPADEPWQREGWGVWYDPSRPDSFLTSLHAIQGNKTYLVHAKQAFQWTVTGKVRFERRKWRADSFNLVGFTVDAAAPPTFGEFFAGANGKIGQRIYRLSGGRWVKVLSPDTTPMRSGEAFWTYCEGQTDFQGPLDIGGPAVGALDFSAVNRRQSIVWRGSGVSVRTVAAAGGGPALPLRRVNRDPDSLVENYPALASVDLSGPAADTSGQLVLQLHREDMSAPEQDVLLKFQDGSGAVVWLPVTATRSED